MTEFIFMWMQKLGYTHPLHPPVTHVPMGMAIAGCLFGLIGAFRRQPALLRSSRHCYVLGLIGIVPTMFLGYMDWQHFYAGAWHPLIVAKILLATLLLVVVSLNIVELRREPPRIRTIVTLCVLGLAIAGNLGFDGGELQYGG
jgi:uncharacterized membrane protein